LTLKTNHDMQVGFMV